jgi:hypothetical protein
MLGSTQLQTLCTHQHSITVDKAIARLEERDFLAQLKQQAADCEKNILVFQK